MKVISAIPDPNPERVISNYSKITANEIARTGRLNEIGENRVLTDWENLDEKTLASVREYYRQNVLANASRVAELGNWPEWIDPNSLAERIPSESKSGAGGFDAGVACALGLIPEDKQKLAATLHAAYTPEAVAQLRTELEDLNPDSETAWWLAACSVCEEGSVDVEKFIAQIADFKDLCKPENIREFLNAAKKAEREMLDTFYEDERFGEGVPFGTKDGCMQGAYLAGHPFAVMYSEEYEIYFIGTFHPSLGLENFEWSSEKDEEGRDLSGPVFGSKQFVKCKDLDEALRAIEYVKKHSANLSEAESPDENIVKVEDLTSKDVYESMISAGTFDFHGTTSDGLYQDRLAFRLNPDDINTFVTVYAVANNYRPIPASKPEDSVAYAINIGEIVELGCWFLQTKDRSLVKAIFEEAVKVLEADGSEAASRQIEAIAEAHGIQATFSS